jgi:hypothetical protein
LKRRELRYKLEEVLFSKYGYILLKKDVSPVFTGEKKICFAEPRERKLEFVDCECEGQTIDRHPKVDEACPMADNMVMYIIHN